MKTYKIYHGNIEGSIPVERKPKPHICIGGPYDSGKKKIPLVGKIGHMMTNDGHLSNIEVVKKKKGYVIVPGSFSSGQDGRILVMWSFTSPEYGSSHIETPKNGVEVIAEAKFFYDGMAISAIIAILQRGQKMYAATIGHEATLLRRARKMRWTLEYNDELPVVRNGRWKKEPILFRRFRNF